MLEEYAKKRDFEVTEEPKGSKQPKSDGGPLTFVVQKHAASTLHYDVRLEHNGALLSWAVPKGPSLNPKDKRLAVKVEDHPLEYASFEGTIPAGQYGGGEVIVWDRGIYYPDKGQGKLGNNRKEQEEAVEMLLGHGTLEVFLEGEKLRGRFVLVHTRGNQWLMIKRTDEYVSEADVLLQDGSVVTGHRIGGVPERAKSFAHPSKPSKEDEPKKPATKSDPKFPSSILPMLLSETNEPFSDPKWTFELKLDGVRVLCFLQDGDLKMVTRNGNDVTSRFPQFTGDLKKLDVQNAILDGEIVLFDQDGKPTFQGLMEGFQAGTAKNADLCLFDIVYLNGKDLRSKPWKGRRPLLEGLKISARHIRLLDTFPEDGQLLYDHATAMGMEGVVAKKIDSTYEPGKRSKDWLKVKSYHSEEFLVGGFTKGQGARESSFGALLVGKEMDGKLVYVGSVGGGFNEAKLDESLALLKDIETKTCPFSEKPPLKNVTWVEPKLVAEVRFMSWTKDKKLRFPIFQRFRPDLTEEKKLPASAKEAAAAAPLTSADVVLEALQDPGENLLLKIEGASIKFSSLNKEFWPGVTKRDLIAYYASAGETLLAYLKDRPVSFVRCPDGIQGERFFQKHWDKGRPEFVEVVSIHSDTNEGARDYVLVNNLPTLLWLGQMSVLELNPWNSRVVSEPGAPESDVNFSESRATLEASVLNRPDYLVLDLDPHFGGKATGWKQPEWERLVEVANVLRELLAQIDVHPYLKSSGKSGLHLYVPLRRDYTYDQLRSAAAVLGNQVIQRLPKRATIEWNTKKRPDGVFIDVNQNVRGKTMAAPYSPRASEGAGVSMPVTWKELANFDPREYTVCTAAERLGLKGDLWRPLLEDKQTLFTPNDVRQDRAEYEPENEVSAHHSGHAMGQVSGD